MNLSQKCEFCPEERANYYTCPKCNAAYCSLQCYRSPKHLQCSETFYRQCVQDEMQLVSKEGVSKDTVTKTYQALLQQQANEEEDQEALDSDDDADDVIGIVERLEGIDLDDADAVWNKLTESERKEFQALVESGEISKFVPEYRPWWDHYYSPKKVQSLEDAKKEAAEFVTAMKRRLPANAGSKPVVDKPKIADLMGRDQIPSPNVKFGLFNVMYAYAFTNRFFRGDFESEQHLLQEFHRILFKICGNLRAVNPQNFDSSQMALESAVASVVENGSELEATQDSAKAIKKDVFKLVRGPGACFPHEKNGSVQATDNLYLLVALSHLQDTLKKSLKVLSDKEQKRSAKLAVKKLDFYLAWVTEFYHQLKN